jgi:hypothetical protein
MKLEVILITVTEGGANTTLLEQSGPVAGLPWLGASK